MAPIRSIASDVPHRRPANSIAPESSVAPCWLVEVSISPPTNRGSTKRCVSELALPWSYILSASPWLFFSTQGRNMYLIHTYPADFLRRAPKFLDRKTNSFSLTSSRFVTNRLVNLITLMRLCADQADCKSTYFPPRLKGWSTPNRQALFPNQISLFLAIKVPWCLVRRRRSS